MTTNQKIRIIANYLLNNIEETKKGRKMLRDLKKLKLQAQRERMAAEDPEWYAEWTRVQEERKAELKKRMAA